MKSAVSRRSFLAASGMTAVSASRVLGANDRIRLGVIGTGGRGRLHIRQINMKENLKQEWVAVCDAWLERAAQGAETCDADNVKQYQDYRHLLDRKDIDAVIITTWDNTHAMIAIDACNAGKDVYVEKPMTNSPEEGLAMVEAVRRNKTILQVGMQQRGIQAFQEAKEKFIDSGIIGDVNMVRTIWNGNGGYLQTVPKGMNKKPADLDWNACRGPLKKVPWDPKMYFNHYAYSDQSAGGATGGLFVHMIDPVHWYLNLLKCDSAVAAGGVYHYKDGRDVPDNFNCVLDYQKKINVTFESTVTDMIRKDNTDIVFMGSGGRLSIFRRGYEFLPADSNKDIGEQIAPGGYDNTMDNWFECMRTRENPMIDVVSGHYSAMACHIANIAYWEKRRVTWRKEWDV